jgi:hypothetical protein
VGSVGLEPTNPEGRRFTVSRLCRFANYPVSNTNGIRTRIYTLRGCYPQPLDDGIICSPNGHRTRISRLKVLYPHQLDDRTIFVVGTGFEPVSSP